MMIGQTGKEDHLLIFLLTVQVRLFFFKSIDTSDLIKDGKKAWVVGQHSGWNWREVCCLSSYGWDF